MEDWTRYQKILDLKKVLRTTASKLKLKEDELSTSHQKEPKMIKALKEQS